MGLYKLKVFFVDGLGFVNCRVVVCVDSFLKYENYYVFVLFLVWFIISNRVLLLIYFLYL